MRLKLPKHFLFHKIFIRHYVNYFLLRLIFSSTCLPFPIRNSRVRKRKRIFYYLNFPFTQNFKFEIQITLWLVFFLMLRDVLVSISSPMLKKYTRFDFMEKVYLIYNKGSIKLLRTRSPKSYLFFTIQAEFLCSTMSLLTYAMPPPLPGTLLLRYSGDKGERITSNLFLVHQKKSKN